MSQVNEITHIIFGNKAGFNKVPVSEAYTHATVAEVEHLLESYGWTGGDGDYVKDRTFVIIRQEPLVQSAECVFPCY